MKAVADQSLGKTLLHKKQKTEKFLFLLKNIMKI